MNGASPTVVRANDAASLRPLFLLDPSVIYLNHGSFGACPISVFETYQSWQLELERNPVRFLKVRAAGLMADARDVLADYVGCPAKDCVFVPNATAGVYLATQSLLALLEPGDEIVMTDHEYQPCQTIWQEVSERTGVRLVVVPITIPYTTDDAFVEEFWARVTPRTKIVFLSHITSITALRFPVKAICARARAADITSIIDGAHAPGHVPLDISDIDPDFYGGSCHKWMLAPKGTGFLYVAEPYQAAMRPLFPSWGWREIADFTVRHHEQGTRDPAALLAVPEAVAFMRAYDWDSVRARSHELALRTRDAIHALTGLAVLTPPTHFSQMCAIPLPQNLAAEAIKEALFERYHIEAPVHALNGSPYLRLSIQGYNDDHDADALIRAMEELLA
ncbi:MAG: aminotransferase class V-fold PLP-dependent enzyme [Anaerolineae bacterium]|nr:aminotransferase class V-fold PLP-dependent enzyme [Anaerolineae bacterium]NUQ02884.1 aminotransferase class V-fold PLP-dependent enzyme [Anaerolineae bacterium]